MKIVKNKSPGLVDIPNKVLVVAIMAVFSKWFAKTFTTCSKECTFPEKCKQQKLLLIPNPNSSCYRPICPLNGINNRLVPVVSLDVMNVKPKTYRTTKRTQRPKSINPRSSLVDNNV